MLTLYFVSLYPSSLTSLTWPHIANRRFFVKKKILNMIERDLIQFWHIFLLHIRGGFQVVAICNRIASCYLVLWNGPLRNPFTHLKSLAVPIGKMCGKEEMLSLTTIAFPFSHFRIDKGIGRISEH